MFIDNFDMDRLATQHQVIVTDYDNVLQWIDLQWLSIFNSKGALDGLDDNIVDMKKCEFKTDIWNDEDKFNFIYNLINRKEYYIDRWFTRKGQVLPKEVQELWYNSYKGVPYFYASIPMTPIAYALRNILEQSWCDELIVLTHSIEDGLKDKRKIEKLKLFFGKHNMQKVKIKFLKPTTSKALWIKKYKPNYTVFIDDRYDIVKEVIMKTDSKHKVFLMPKFGWNQDYLIDEDFQPLIAGLGATFSQFIDIANMEVNGNLQVIRNVRKD